MLADTLKDLLEDSESLFALFINFEFGKLLLTGNYLSIILIFLNRMNIDIDI